MSVFQVQAKDAIYSINQYSTINAMQNFNWDPAFNEEYTEELGNEGYSSQSISPEITGSFDVNATGSTVAILNRMLMNLDAVGDFQGYTFATGTPNTGTIRGADLEYCVFDLIGSKKTNEVFTRAEFFPRCFLSTLAFSADANGNASETYSFEGQLTDIYRSPYHDLISHPAVYASASSVDILDETFFCDIPSGGTVTTPTHFIIAVQVNEVVYGLTDIDNVDDNTAAGPITITFVAGISIPVGARVMVWTYKETPGSFPSVYNPTTARFVRANNIDMWIVDVGTVDIEGLADGALITQAFTNTDSFLRVQSFDMNIDLRREVLRQIRKSGDLSAVYYRAATYPLQVTASASTLESDLEAWRKITGASASPADGNDTLDLDSFDGKVFQLVVRYYVGDEVVQTMAFTDARVTGMSQSMSVGGRGEVSWSFTGSKIVIEGDDV